MPGARRRVRARPRSGAVRPERRHPARRQRVRRRRRPARRVDARPAPGRLPRVRAALGFCAFGNRRRARRGARASASGGSGGRDPSAHTGALELVRARGGSGRLREARRRNRKAKTEKRARSAAVCAETRRRRLRLDALEGRQTSRSRRDVSVPAAALRARVEPGQGGRLAGRRGRGPVGSGVQSGVERRDRLGGFGVSVSRRAFVLRNYGSLRTFDEAAARRRDASPEGLGDAVPKGDDATPSRLRRRRSASLCVALRRSASLCV